jgi:hypothetical protein
MGGTSWTLQIKLSAPDDGAALHLTVVLETRTRPEGITRGSASLRARYPTEAEAREAMALVLEARPEVRCRVQADPPPAGT